MSTLTQTPSPREIGVLAANLNPTARAKPRMVRTLKGNATVEPTDGGGVILHYQDGTHTVLNAREAAIIARLR